MLSRFASRCRPTFSRINRVSIQRQFANTKKKSKWGVRSLVIAGVGSVACIGAWTYEYAVSKTFQDQMDEKYLCHLPMIQKFLTKWVVSDEQSPYRIFVCIVAFFKE